MSSLAFHELEGVSAERFAAFSQAWPTSGPEAASMLVGVPADEAVVLGAFQRTSEVSSGPRVRRGSGGAAARVGPGTIWVQLALARADALVACSPDKLLNRYVRPLLRALTRITGIPAGYFGRDWIGMAHRPVALVAFAHDADSGRCLFEAFVGVRSPFETEPRASFLGKAPATLEELAGRSIDPSAACAAIVDAYRTLAGGAHEAPLPESLPEASPLADEPAWTATREEAIGLVAAGRDASGRLRVGGELMASADAVRRLEDRLASGGTVEDVGRHVDEALTTGGAITFGVRSLASIRDVVVEALVT